MGLHYYTWHAVLALEFTSMRIKPRHYHILMLLAIGGKERTRLQWEDLYRSTGFWITSITPLHDNFGTSIVEGVKL
jgi:hypothetical protein